MKMLRCVLAKLLNLKNKDFFQSRKWKKQVTRRVSHILPAVVGVGRQQITYTKS